MDICLARRIVRDVEQRGRNVVSVIEQYNNSVRPMAIKYIMPCKQNADIILSNNVEQFNHILKLITDKLNNE